MRSLYASMEFNRQKCSKGIARCSNIVIIILPIKYDSSTYLYIYIVFLFTVYVIPHYNTDATCLLLLTLTKKFYFICAAHKGDEKDNDDTYVVAAAVALVALRMRK